MNSDGTGLTSLYSVEGDIQDNFGIAFSPDGSYVAFTAYADEASLANLVVCRADQSGAAPWIFDIDQDHFGVSWHPTQNLLLCVADKYVGNNIDNDLDSTILRVVSFPSGAKRDLLVENDTDESGITSAHWSRDGNRVAFVHNDDLYRASLIYATPASLPTMGAPTNLTPGSVGPAFPESARFCDVDNRIAVLDGDPDTADIDLWVCNGTTWTRRVNNLSVAGFNWSPDGENLVFSAGPPAAVFLEGEEEEEEYEPTRCYMVPSTGAGGAREITPEGFTHADYGAPAWWSSI